MKYTEKQIKTKLSIIQYQNAKNGKIFYSLNDIFKEFKMSDYKTAFDTIQTLKQKLLEISYPVKNVLQYKKKTIKDYETTLSNTNNFIVEEKKVYDVFLSQTGVFLVFASLAKTMQNENDRELCYNISKVSYIKDFVFYPESRLLLRNDYTETTKSLRSRVKKIYINDDYVSISERLNTLYHTIICAYYNVENSEELCYKKFNNPNKKYLDYVSLRELRDLQDIQNTMLYNLTNKPSSDYLQIARYEALIKRKKFIYDYGFGPLYYEPHSNKPLKMLKQFNSLRESLKIDELSLKEDIDTFEK